MFIKGKEIDITEFMTHPMCVFIIMFPGVADVVYAGRACKDYQNDRVNLWGGREGSNTCITSPEQLYRVAQKERNTYDH